MVDKYYFVVCHSVTVYKMPRYRIVYSLNLLSSNGNNWHLFFEHLSLHPAHYCCEEPNSSCTCSHCHMSACFNEWSLRTSNSLKTASMHCWKDIAKSGRKILLANIWFPKYHSLKMLNKTDLNGATWWQWNRAVNTILTYWHRWSWHSKHVGKQFISTPCRYRAT